MKNFYYVQTYNLLNPKIRAMLDNLGIFKIHDSLFELKTRSKNFYGYNEALLHTQLDFKLHLAKIFPDTDDKGEPTENEIKIINVVNPKFAMIDNEEDYGEQEWDENCCATMFFCNSEIESEDFPVAWMMKYEIFNEDDSIVLVLKNGEHAFDPSQVAYQNFSSALH